MFQFSLKEDQNIHVTPACHSSYSHTTAVDRSQTLAATHPNLPFLLLSVWKKNVATGTSGHHLQSFGFFPFGSINLGFLLRENLDAIFIIPSSWGSQLDGALHYQYRAASITICLLFLMIMVMRIIILLNLLLLRLFMWGVLILLFIWLMIGILYVIVILLVLFMMLLKVIMREGNMV
jgi:hypothetical protein